MTIHEFIKKRPYLIWYTKNYDGLSEGSIVEATLNYGDFDDVKKLLKILGIKKVAKIFRKQMRRRWGRTNYSSKIANYFQLFFQKYV